MSERANIKWGMIIAKYQYGVLERQKGNYDKAQTFFEEYVAYAKEQMDEIQVANGLYQKALIFDTRGQHEKSLEIYYRILKIYEDNDDEYSAANILNSLGEILKNSNRFNEAMNNYNKALEIFTRLDAKTDMANCYFNIGGTYLLLKNYGDALIYFNKALVLDKEINSLWGAAYDYESIGEVYSLQGRYNEALQVHLKALAIREQLQQKRELAAAYTKVGIDYLKLKNYGEAKVNLEKSLFYAEDVGANNELRDVYEWISKLNAEMGNYKEALEFNQKFIVVKDSLFNATKSMQIEELQERFNSEKKQDAIIALEKDAEIKDLRLKRRTSLQNISIVIAIATILFFLFLFNRYKYRQRVRQEALEKKRLLEVERQKTEHEKQRVEELEKIDKLKDEFLANTSHELRTPLNGIIGLSESLKDGAAGKLSPKVIENLSMISNSGKRLTHLVNDILDFSKLKNKDLDLSIQPVDIYATVSVVLKLSEPFIRNSDLKLINAVSKDVALVDADENRLQQIFYNLIGNAIKFTEKGHIEIAAEAKDNLLLISVTDTGIGIPESKFEDIFKSFEQADGSTQREFGGTGLGLSVSKQLVELHGGTIGVRSVVGQGSKFTFSLPLSTRSREKIDIDSADLDENVQQVDKNFEDQVEAISSHEGLQKAPTNILIVDDELINRRVLENHLTVAGYGVTEVAGGKEALALIDKGVQFDLVLLDVMMPNMSGYEVCQTIRKKISNSELPIVLLTAKNRVSDLVAGFNVGANDYLTKPFSKNELLSRIKAHLNLKNIHSASSKFVPTEFLKSVGRESITDVVLGDHIQKNVSVLFTDVRDYTTLAESMSPRQNFKFVNAYVGRMGPLIQKNEGFVNQYLGDGIMALFPKGSENALQAAIDMQKMINVYNLRRIDEGYVSISVGMGLHTGPLVMGIIGDTNRNDTAIIADTVNTASRMEGITKYYGARIILSEESLKNISDPDNYNFRYLGKVQVKGKDKIIGVYECYDGDTNEMIALKNETREDFEKGMSYFFDKEFPKASAVFDQLLQKNDKDKVAEYFMTKSAELTLSGVSNDWEFVNTMKAK